jgi:hypothetical protein
MPGYSRGYALFTAPSCISRLLLLALLPPATSWAQTTIPPLSGSANVHVLELATRTSLYRHLRDTSTTHAKHLRPGGFIIVRAAYGQWLAVVRAKSRTQFSKDTTTYYLPQAALKGAKIWVII